MLQVTFEFLRYFPALIISVSVLEINENQRTTFGVSCHLIKNFSRTALLNISLGASFHIHTEKRMNFVAKLNKRHFK